MQSEPATLAEVFRRGVEAFPRPDRYLRKAGAAWTPVSTAELDRQVKACAAGLAALGLKPGDRAAILSYNRIEWVVADWACQLMGVADVPIYSTLPADQVDYILRDADVRMVFVENAEQAEKVKAAGLPVVAFDPAPGCEPFDDFLRRGGEPPAFAPAPDDLATLIYTSGTTGVPKGVMLTHRNLVSNFAACCTLLSIGPEDLLLSFLPLSHSFERILDYAAFHRGASIAHAEDIDKVVANLQEVRPTVMGAVPRFYEKVYARIQETARGMSGFRRGIFEWARRVGAADAECRRSGVRPPFLLGLKTAVARRLVFRKMADKVGGRIRLFISGGGALSRDVAEYMWSLGFTLVEGYGLTETAPVLCLNAPGGVKLGTVGRPIPGVEIRLASDGEILARGPNIMKGYLNKPEETAAVFVDGWFATGDIGELDPEGYLRITDRKKDLLKTSGGKYVAPQPIENRLKLSPHLRNAVVIGDARKFPAALLVPAPGATQAQLQAAVDEVNAMLPHHEQIKKFAVVEHDFTIEGGELTPTLKVRRRVVEKKYAALIDGLYGDGY